jgi:hypothetical protein
MLRCTTLVLGMAGRRDLGFTIPWRRHKLAKGLRIADHLIEMLCDDGRLGDVLAAIRHALPCE